MKATLSFLIISAFIMLNSCNDCSNEEYKRLDFGGQIHSVRDSINLMKEIVYNLPDSEVKNVYIDIHQKLVINNVEYGDWKTILNENKLKNKVQLNDSTPLEKLVSTMSFLNENGINGAYLNIRHGVVVFLYKDDVFKYCEHDDRSIILEKDLTKGIKDSFNVMDVNSGLVLLSPQKDRYIQLP